MTEAIIVALVAAFSSSGVCSIVLYVLQRRDGRKDRSEAETKYIKDKLSLLASVLRGLGHDRVTYLGGQYIKRGWISHDEYENLHDYIFVPYKEIGGNGSADKIMAEVEKLPLRDKAPERIGGNS